MFSLLVMTAGLYSEESIKASDAGIIYRHDDYRSFIVNAPGNFALYSPQPAKDIGDDRIS